MFSDVFSCDRRHNFRLSDTKQSAIKLTVVQGSGGTGTHRNAVPVLFLQPGTAFRFFFTT